MKIWVWPLWHVVVDDNINSFNVNASAEQVSCHHDALVELFELLVPGNALLLVQARMNCDRREAAILQQTVERFASAHTLHKNHYLIELQQIEQIIQLAILFFFLELDVVLQKPVQCQFGFIIHEYFMRILHKSLAYRSSIRRQGGGEHHSLLLLRRFDEQPLHILTHIQLLHDIVTFVHNEVSDFAKVQRVITDQSIQTARSSNQDVRRFGGVFQSGLVVINACATVHHRSSDALEILREPLELVLDLKSQLTSVHQG
mmetsp:Transcript_10546/g.25062  ORF Transcript_10546/g.25062 Transcript_10546/m.25062 type:complete len:259 (+) Transcript_10546:208-984(+)